MHKNRLFSKELNLMIFHVMTCKIFAVLLYDIKCFLSHYLFFFLSLSLVKEDAMGQNRGMVEKVAQGGKNHDMK